jgi:hypothetical protein
VAIDRDNGVRRVSVGELLSEALWIPPYQRPYSWHPGTALQLLDDIRLAFRADVRAGEASYVLGAVILHRDGETLNVVDGQQRLLTLTMLLDILDVAAAGSDAHIPAGAIEDPAAPVVVARQRLTSRVKLMEDDPEHLAAFVREGCELIRVETDDADEAFRVFDSQNYRGKALLPHDLLKAYHLREMQGDSDAMKAALVETWESVDDSDLDRLFSTYLWRIRQWSRGLAAPPFSIRNIGAFKGLTTKTADTPAARYHLAAQATIPLLTSWATLITTDDRTASRSRFQLDAPVQAGRSFFEMVSFMLAELRRLRREGYAEDGWDVYASTDVDFDEESSKSQFRYVSELYLAALLYYTNKFGDTELRESKRLLFRWAYSLRTRLRRVQMVSINNHARDLTDGKSPFVLVRNADGPSDLRRLSAEVTGREQDPEHMKDLLTFLNGLGS